MNYTVSNTINKPLDEVLSKFNDPDGLKHWMEGLQKTELLSGKQGEVGAVTEMLFLHKGKEFSMTETILEDNLPKQIKFAYNSPSGYNEVEMMFEEISENSVLQKNNSYFKLQGAMKVMGPLMKGMFKKQSMKYLDAFKEYAEK